MSRVLQASCLIAAVAFVGATAVAIRADAEQTSRAGVRVSFRGSFEPKRIPRHRPVPISLTLEGAVRGEQGQPPRLRRIDLAFGARGGLDIVGLPVCRRSQLRNATSGQALARCADALVGHGTITADVPFSRAEPLLVQADVLVFNGRWHGRPAAWVHAFAASPPATFVLPFHLNRPRTGSYGVQMSSPVGRALGRWPRLRSFRITLGRRFSVAGRPHSYLNAHCPLAPRYTFLSVPFARATFRFTPGPTIAQPIRRFCVVRQ
jgi:hypothetical protein